MAQRAMKKAAVTKPATPKAAVPKVAGKKAIGKKAAAKKTNGQAAAAKKQTGRKAMAADKPAAAQLGRRTFMVRISNTGQEFACASGQTILHAAVSAGIDYPYACASGNCGTCVSQLTEGKVSLLPRNDTSLTAAQVEAKQTLACRARPRSDVTIAWLGRGGR